MITTTPQPLEHIALLLVEDYPINVRFAKGVLERLGATVDVASDGQEALAKLDPVRHQLVLMDIQMPVMDGYESARLMRARGHTLPIVALTADAAPETVEKIRASGLNDVLVKPFKADVLVAMVQKYCQAARYKAG